MARMRSEQSAVVEVIGELSKFETVINGIGSDIETLKANIAQDEQRKKELIGPALVKKEPAAVKEFNSLDEKIIKDGRRLSDLIEALTIANSGFQSTELKLKDLQKLAIVVGIEKAKADKSELKEKLLAKTHEMADIWGKIKEFNVLIYHETCKLGINDGRILEDRGTEWEVFDIINPILPKYSTLKGDRFTKGEKEKGIFNIDNGPNLEKAKPDPERHETEAVSLIRDWSKEAVAMKVELEKAGAVLSPEEIENAGLK